MHLRQDSRSGHGMRRHSPRVVGRIPSTTAALAHTAPVAGPPRLRAPRRVATHRRPVHLAGYLTALAVMVAALAACGNAPQRSGAPPGSPPVPPPSPTQVTAGPTPPSLSTVKTSPAARTVQLSTCRASDFRLVSINNDGAMGSLYTTVAVVYQGHGGCHMVSTPTLRYRTAAGRLVPVPTVREGGRPGTVTIRPGEGLFFVIRTVNGYGGYGPTSPQCAHPATYRQIQLRLGESYLDLRDWQLTVLCGPISVRDWAPGTAP